MAETKGDDKTPKKDGKSPNKDDKEICEACKLIFVANDKCIACDICGTWFHQTCTGLNAQTYKSLNNCKDNSLGWYCKICRKVSQPLHVKMLELQLGQEKLREQIRNLEESKVSKEELETRVQDALKTPASQETIKKLVKEAGATGGGDTYAAARQALLDKEEETKRMNNIVIHRLEESKEENMEDQKMEDRNKIEEIMKVLDANFEMEKIDEITRLGAKKETSARPVLVRLSLYNTKTKLMENLKKLKDSPWKVSLSHDLPKGTRNYHKSLIDKARQEKGGEAENFTFRVVGTQGREKVKCKAKK